MDECVGVSVCVSLAVRFVQRSCALRFVFPLQIRWALQGECSARMVHGHGAVAQPAIVEMELLELVFFVVFCLFLHTSQRNGSDRNHLPAEPMGLENMLLTAQMESLCDQATDAAADSTARLYFVNDLLHK